MSEVGAVKKTKKKLKLKKKVVGATGSGKKLTINVKEERKTVTDDEILDGLEQHEVSVFDLVPFDANEESEGVGALKLDESEKSNDGDESDVAPPPAPKPVVKKEKKTVRFDKTEESEEVPSEVKKAKVDDNKEDKKLKKIKDLVKDEDDSDKTVFTSLDDLKEHLDRFKQEQHLRRWMKKLMLTKRISKALRNEACDYWMKAKEGKDEVAKETALTRDEMEALVQMEGTFHEVKKAVNDLQRAGRLDRKECGSILKKWKARERRRVARQMQHAPLNLECFNCRQRGHVFADCPDKKKKLDEGTGICFKCGSMEHAIYKCPKKDKIKGFPHATCFICGARGHLSKECEKNEHGIYIDGGSCDLCGSKMHLRKNCDKQALKEQNEEEKAKTKKEPVDGEEAMETEEEQTPRGIKRPAVKKEDNDDEADGKKDKSRVLSSKKWGKKAEDGTATTVTRPVAAGPAKHEGGDDDDFQFLAGEDGDEPFKPSDNEDGPPHKRMKMFGGGGRGRGGGGGMRGGGGFRGRGGDRGGFRGRGGGGDGGFRGRGGFRGTGANGQEGGFRGGGGSFRGGDRGRGRGGGGGFRGGRGGDRGGFGGRGGGRGGGGGRGRGGGGGGFRGRY